MSIQYYRDNTIANGNIDSELLKPAIIKAQNMHIERLLGTTLFDKVISDIDNNTVSGNTKILLDSYIQPTLLEWTTYEALPWLNYKLTNKAVSKKNSDNSDYSELSEVGWLMSNVRDDAEYLSRRLVDYLCANEELFPEYKTGNDDEDDIKPTSDTYFSGFIL